MMTGPSAPEGIDATSPRRMPIRGCDAIASVTRDENRSRPPAGPPPAGTRVSSAARIASDPSRRISSLRRPTALSSLSPRKEFEQTSSARPSVLWTAVGFTGRISYKVTGTLRAATCQAASLPARPPPMMVTRAIWLNDDSCGCQFLRPHVRALFVVTNQLPPALLGDLLHQERRLALRARLGNRAVPQREIAVWIVRAPEEHLPAAGLALDDVPAVFPTEDPGRLLLYVLTRARN